MCLGVFALVAFGVVPVGRADDAPAQGARAERLSSVDGHVQVIQGDQVIADPAIINAPLFEGTQVVTMDDGRAEIQFEDGSVARLSPNSSLTLSVLKPDDGPAGTQIVLDTGLAYFELQSGSQPGRIQVKFGSSVVSASGFTVLRINLDNPPGELAVFSGNAHIDRGSIALDMRGGESVQFDASSPAQYNLAETVEPDSWDAWNSDRDQVLNGEASQRTAASGNFQNNPNPAWSDLDANGNWYDVPGQGYVWSPYDASNPGWDPYGNGYWMLNPGYGYMWVSGDSWGYLPFNCGMWNYYGGFGWGWAPGLGVCSPWWGGGGFFPINIGIFPIGYLPPRIPRRPPSRGPVGPGRRRQPVPLIAVNKRPPSGAVPQAPRNRNVSATIAGHLVMPLRPLSPRPLYDRLGNGYVNRSLPVVTNGRGPAVPGTTVAPVVNGVRPAPAPAPVGRPAPAPVVRPAPHVSAPPAPHVSAPAPAPHASGGGSAHH